MKPPENRAGQLIRHHRLRLHLTQAELASKTGISTGYMTMLERGLRTQPSGDLVKHLVEALKLTGPDAEELRTALRTKEPSPPPDRKEILGSPFLRSLAEFLALPSESPDRPRVFERAMDELRAVLAAGGSVEGAPQSAVETARLLGMGYFCTTPKSGRRGKGRRARRTKEEQDTMLGDQIRILMGLLVDPKVPVTRRISLAREMVSFGRWKLRDEAASKEG